MKKTSVTTVLIELNSYGEGLSSIARSVDYIEYKVFVDGELYHTTKQRVDIDNEDHPVRIFEKWLLGIRQDKSESSCNKEGLKEFLAPIVQEILDERIEKTNEERNRRFSSYFQSLIERFVLENYHVSHPNSDKK